MSGSDNEFHDDWFDGLTDAEYAELRRITTPQERKIIIACAQRYDDVKCDNKIKGILRNMQRRGINLELIWKYTWQSLEDRRHHEKVADFINEVKREGQGVKIRRGTKRKRGTGRKRKTQGRKRSRRR